MPDKTPNILTGKIIISEPFLSDVYFRRSVVLLADHSKEEGAFGVIINKPIKVPVGKILPDFQEIKSSVYMGGPIKADSVFFIHTLGDIIKNSYEILPGLYWGGEYESLVENKQYILDDPSCIRFYIGYSGWSPNQLEDELKAKSWVISSTNPNEIMSKTAKTLWKKILKRMGKEYAEWINYPLDPMMN